MKTPIEWAEQINDDENSMAQLQLAKHAIEHGCPHSIPTDGLCCKISFLRHAKLAAEQQLEAIKKKYPFINSTDFQWAALIERNKYLEQQVAELRKDKAYLTWRLQHIVPLFQDARDAL